MAAQFGIIGGRFRGAKLYAPPEGVTRPLRAVVKKSLFDILSDNVAGAAVLDLYAGSGSIGLEAVSRGARLCVFVESNRGVYSVLKKNVDKIARGVDNGAIHMRPVMADVEEFLRSGPVSEAPFDIVFLDPPFAAKAAAGNCMALLSGDTGWMAPEGLLVYHFRAGDDDFEFNGWRMIDSRVMGDCRIAFLTRGDD